MPETPSFQDLFRGLPEEVFVGRAAEVSLFNDVLSASPRPFLILSIWGQGGVGKSTLIERFRQVATERGAAAAIANDEQSDVPTTLARFAGQLDEAGQKFKEFDKRHRRYQELRRGIASDPGAPPGVLDFLVRNAASIAVRSASLVPLGAEAREVLLGQNAPAEAGEFASAALAYVGHKFKRDDKVLLLDTERVLTEAFLAGLDHLASHRAVVLGFDTHERTAAYLDKWLRDVLVGSFGSFSGNVLFVISGRARLDQGWNALRRAIREVELHVFDQAEARSYLSSRGVTEDEHVAELLKASKGLPVFLALLTSSERSAAEATGDVVERFLQGASSEQQEAALVASVPRVFDEDVLAVLLGERARGAFESLSKASYVRLGARGWAYHDVVRPLMLRHLYRRSPIGCAELHERLAGFYAARCASLGVPTDEQTTDEAWLALDTERLYHSLSAGARRTIVPFLAAMLDKVTSPGGLDRYVDLLEQVGEELEDPILRDWATDLRKIVASTASRDWTGALRAATRLCELAGLDERSRSHALVLRGWLHLWAKLPDRAVRDFSAAIDLEPDRLTTYNARALARIQTRDLEGSIADFEAAARFSRDPSVVWWLAGTVFLTAGQLPQALDCYSRAVQKPDFAFAHLGYGVALAVAGSAEAEAELTRAIELDPGVAASAHAWRALALLQLGEDPRARTAADTSLELGGGDDDRSIALQVRGTLSYQEGDLRGALADFTTATELQPTNGLTHLLRAQVLLALGEHAETLTECDRAMELGKRDAETHIQRGLALFGLSRVAEAKVDFERAHELEPERADVAYNLACAWAREGSTDEACGWLRAAVKLDPTNLETARGDSDFDTIRGTSAFAAILGSSAPG